MIFQSFPLSRKVPANFHADDVARGQPGRFSAPLCKGGGGLLLTVRPWIETPAAMHGKSREHLWVPDPAQASTHVIHVKTARGESRAMHVSAYMGAHRKAIGHINYLDS